MIHHSRSAFAMIMAIFVIVIITTILVLSLKLTAQATKRTTELYLYEQAEVLAYNAAEYAMYKMGTTPCSFDPATDANYPFTQDDLYTIDLNVQYMTSGTACNGARAGLEWIEVGAFNDDTAVIDVTVTIDDPTISPERIRYYKRYIQKL